MSTRARSVAKTKTKARKQKASDAQLGEFEKRDLGSDIRASGTARVLRPRSRPTSIVLEADLVEKLRIKGARRGLGYQTMLKMIVREHVDKY